MIPKELSVKKKKKKKLNVKSWTTKVFYNDNYDNLIDDNDQNKLTLMIRMKAGDALIK